MKIQSILFSAFALAAIRAQETPANPAEQPKAPQETAHKEVSICYETFSLSLAMAAKLQREQLPDSELYARVLAAVEKQTARQETFLVVRSRSSQHVTTANTSEQIYPTEFEPGKLPGSVAFSVTPSASVPDAGKPGKTPEPPMFKGLMTPATPTAFETRNTGVTLEIEQTLSDDNKSVNLRLVPEHVTPVGRVSFGQGVSTTEMAIFETQRCNTAVSLRINNPFLLSTMNRPKVSKVDTDSANRVWFAFLTATLAKP